MQDIINDGVKELNRLSTEVKAREKELLEIKDQISLTEAYTLSPGFIEKKVQELETQLENVQTEILKTEMERDIMSNMQETRKHDLQLMMKPMLKNAEIYDRIRGYVSNQTEKLVLSVKELEQLAVRFLQIICLRGLL
jgi:alanyl-tRNA synthetase